MFDNYEEYHRLFVEYLNKQIQSSLDKLKNIEQNNKLKKIYRELQSKSHLKFIEHYEILSKVNSTVKDNLDVIDYLVKNDIVSAPQMEEAMNNILSDKGLLKLISNNESKELLEGKVEKLTSIINGTCDFETLKNALISSDLSDECILGILNHEAEKSTSVTKKELPSLENTNNENKEIDNNYKNIINKINEFVKKYYYLVESKPSNLIDMYRKTISATHMDRINDFYTEKDVLVCMHVLYLLKLKDELDDVLNTKPVDYSLLEIGIEEITSAYENALSISKEYDKEKKESIITESSLYFLLDNGNISIDTEKYTNEEKKTISSILNDLEMGLFDYERNKNGHTVVLQSIRKDLNVFVNRKRNMSVSFIRINSEELNESKVLVLGIDDFRKIFDTTQRILKTNGRVIDDNIKSIKDNNNGFKEQEDAIREDVLSKLSKEEVMHHE